MRTLILVFFVCNMGWGAISSSLRFSNSSMLELSPDVSFVLDIGQGFAVGPSYLYWEKQVDGVDEIFHDAGVEFQYFFSGKSFTDSLFVRANLGYRNLSLRQYGGSAKASYFNLRSLVGYHVRFGRWSMFWGAGVSGSTSKAIDIRQDNGELVNSYDRLTRARFLLDWSLGCQF